MAKSKKLKEEHIAQLTKLEQNKKALIEELGKVALQEILIEKRRDRAENFLDTINQEEASLGKLLTEVYGAGKIDLPNKVFIPAE